MIEPARHLLGLLLAHPLTSSAVLLASALIWAVLMHVLVDGINGGRHPWQRRLRARLGVAPGKRLGELRWMLWSMHLVLWPLVAWAFLHLWGLHDEGQNIVEKFFDRGFTLSGLTIVPGKLLLGTVYFLALLTFTRWLKRKIEHDWLPLTAIEANTRQSLATLFGYATFLIAALVGLTAAGFDFTKLAIVAGALSVGIGFGLQNIVNNFVSGLIILFERPVRIGDYIFVGETQGFVRKIRIRATELETWDRESVVVPNSDLLSNHLRNLNLRDSFGRVIVGVGVAYGSDTLKVKQVLLDVACANPQVIRDGELDGLSGPGIYFVNFGDSSLDFELRAYIRAVDKRLSVASELRFAIDQAFRQNHIDIPFPQRDLWMRNAPPSAPAAPTDGI
ncbi:mechanosensitive ion channel family protein [Sinimarinibacterium sp. CAU 1509]|uniref:mechanosensitive ion channel family protein n=1 Tax=Sinimarinibacterium sp. CAU 1509 TaxID=2562283 RepID=UPI0010ACC129|nr:mechanosensitive ion channel domain-containing protein [Sinimarinibacterium sp. CAU 1509]TJY62190.1 mechanosensitive ion channel family protein [Sinimarinibacterium sp. CAU 1509]